MPGTRYPSSAVFCWYHPGFVYWLMKGPADVFVTRVFCGMHYGLNGDEYIVAIVLLCSLPRQRRLERQAG